MNISLNYEEIDHCTREGFSARSTLSLHSHIMLFKPFLRIIKEMRAIVIDNSYSSDLNLLLPQEITVVGLKKGPWTQEEDQKLLAYIEEHGHGSWRSLPEKAGLHRCGKSCRLRWTNYLRPDIKRGKFNLQEEQTIIQLHALLGNSHMAQWESARLEAEARLARESKILHYQTKPSSHHHHGFTHKTLLTTWTCKTNQGNADQQQQQLESPTSTVSFSEMKDLSAKTEFVGSSTCLNLIKEPENDWFNSTVHEFEATEMAGGVDEGFTGLMLAGDSLGRSFSAEKNETVVLPARCRVVIGERKKHDLSFFLFFLLSLFRSLLSLGKRRFDSSSLPFRGSHRRNGDGSIGVSRRRRKTATFLSVALLDFGKRRETVTSVSISGSLRRSIPATVAAEANRKWNRSRGMMLVYFENLGAQLLYSGSLIVSSRMLFLAKGSSRNFNL
ncbi:hypothetical protein F2Q70_00007452 [Brassica cretica]|uniref:Uncharacterized protein n=1 Tax=Brassica cretica TaxID=69181 RepID=A0A8S9LVY7_BRACR|nr:hypothetical protein F2Q70_00007452 [Brassica cretica]